MPVQATDDFNFGDNHAGCYCAFPACEVRDGKNIKQQKLFGSDRVLRKTMASPRKLAQKI